MRNGRKYMLLILDGHFNSDLTPDPRIYPSWPELPVVPNDLSIVAWSPNHPSIEIAGQS